MIRIIYKSPRLGNFAFYEIIQQGQKLKCCTYWNRGTNCVGRKEQHSTFMERREWRINRKIYVFFNRKNRKIYVKTDRVYALFKKEIHMIFDSNNMGEKKALWAAERGSHYKQNQFIWKKKYHKLLVLFFWLKNYWSCYLHYKVDMSMIELEVDQDFVLDLCATKPRN